MQIVIVERQFAEASVFEDLQAAEDAVAWCLEQHRVRFVRSYLSLDARSMVCVYEAPDAESVREVQRRSGLPVARLWAAEVLETSGRHEATPGLSTVVVERDFDAPVTREVVAERMSGADGCLSVNRAALLESNLSLDRRRMVCLFEAPDAESVRRANREIGLPVARVWSATMHPC